MKIVVFRIVCCFLYVILQIIIKLLILIIKSHLSYISRTNIKVKSVNIKSFH